MRRLILFAAVLLITLIPAGNVSADDVVVDPGQWRQQDSGVVWINRDIGYLIYQDQTTPRIAWTKTMDGGVTWTTPVTIQSACNSAALDVWYDRWTKGNIGTEIHISWFRNFDTGDFCGGRDNINYNSLDVSNDTLSGTVVASTVTGTSVHCGSSRCDLTVTRARGGNLYIHAQLYTSSFQQRFLVSTNGGTSWSTGSLGPSGTSFTGPIMSFNQDNDILIGDGVDVDNDIVAWDYTNEQYNLYDYSADNWLTTSSFSTGETHCSTNTTSWKRCITRSVNTSGESISPAGVEKMFVGQLTGGSTCTASACTFHVFVMDGATNVEKKTNVFTSRSNIINIGLTFDVNENNLYAFYADFNVDEIYYRVSDDYGDSWGVETRFDDTANAKLEVLTASAFTSSGARLMPIWEEGTALVTNLDSVVTLGTSPTPDEQDFPNKLDRFRIGLNMTGNTGEVAFALGMAFLLAIITIAFGMPKILMVVLEFFWLTAMAMPPIEYLPAGIYLSAFLVMGVLFVFLLINTIFGSRTSGEDF